MIKVDRWKFENRLKYFRKIHIFSNLWFISIYGKTTKEKTNLNVTNIIKFILSFIFIPVIIKE